METRREAGTNDIHTQGSVRHYVWRKEFIMSATTVKEIREILKPSIPKWSRGQWHTSPYHVEEEELIYWAMFTLHHNPGPEAIQRYITVFDRYYQANPV